MLLFLNSIPQLYSSTIFLNSILPRPTSGVSVPTRCFLPKSSSLSMKGLPAYVLETTKAEPDMMNHNADPMPTLLELTLVRSREKIQFQSHDTLLCFKLLDRKIRLLEGGNGAGAIIEGEVGSRKTTALCRFLVYCTAGSPFDGGCWARTAFGVW